MKKILICQNELSGYNVPVYNIIAERYNLTVAFYLKDKSSIDCKFKKLKLEARRIGPFTFIRHFKRIAKQYDLVSILPNLRVPSYFILPFLSRKNKLVNWSIGFRASYTNPYEVSRKHVFADKLFQMLLNRCDASIFYMEKAKEFWKGTSLDMNKVFVAPNTTDVEPITIKGEAKKIFLFVGTLYKGKGLDILLKSYHDAVINEDISNQLHIVGDGAERQNLENYVKNNSLIDKVIFHGAIYDERILARCFSEALLCVSPTQGGLSVPKSMGYGVPFVTRRDAITGGEIYHITPGVNGIMYEKDNELTAILIDAANNPQKYVEMGFKAKVYYDNHATVRHMAQGAMDAFDYALKN